MSALAASPDTSQDAARSWPDAASDVVREIAGGHLDEPLRYAADVAGEAAGADTATVLPATTSAVPTLSATADGTVVLAPLRDSVGVRGVLSLGRRAGRPAFTDTDLALATMFAGQVALALELADRSARRDRAVRIDERDRIARELTLDVIGRLFALGLVLQGAAAHADPASRRQLAQGADEIDETVKQIRATIYRLGDRPAPPSR